MRDIKNAARRSSGWTLTKAAVKLSLTIPESPATCSWTPEHVCPSPLCKVLRTSYFGGVRAPLVERQVRAGCPLQARQHGARHASPGCRHGGVDVSAVRRYNAPPLQGPQLLCAGRRRLIFRNFQRVQGCLHRISGLGHCTRQRPTAGYTPERDLEKAKQADRPRVRRIHPVPPTARRRPSDTQTFSSLSSSLTSVPHEAHNPPSAS
ncbi:hypothetical protein EDB81DRAFT_797322 [Dactylonectria macrodidyma]|uniref:Uncharacterized protein n=1 Tax=Dactylonectria macrodidyma TaxID=307937 RepID=A0A9P9EUD3_9HYPO|nr:hypothetical protein EDB81DRAFT_797322 [Dactylonectria macrodidyma]